MIDELHDSLCALIESDEVRPLCMDVPEDRLRLRLLISGVLVAGRWEEANQAKETRNRKISQLDQDTEGLLSAAQWDGMLECAIGSLVDEARRGAHE